MKVFAINGSPKEMGNTGTSLNIMKDVFAEQGIEMEIMTIGNKLIHGCVGCGACRKLKSNRCEFVKDDIVNEAIAKMTEADGIIIGSPVYFSGINGTLKSFLDRAFYAGGSNFAHKVGAGLVAVRRTGGSESFYELLKYFTYAQMITPSSTYWNVVHGGKPEEVLQDEEGVHTLKVLADNMTYLMKVLDETKVEKPAPREKKWTSFIR